ncbi:efflux RND transporter periplasmic adaptor subunit [Microbacteriaceae bacterium 4G12]
MQIETVRPSKKKWIIIGVIALVIIVVAINVVAMQGKKKGAQQDLKFAEAKERTLHNTKLVSGRVMPGNIETLYPDATKGKVKEIFVKEGDEIEKGAKLFSYENAELTSQIKQAELQKKITSIKYDQEKEQVDSLKKEIQKMKDAGADATKLQDSLKEMELQQKSAELEMERGKLQMADLQKKQNDLIIYSSTNGVVQKVDKDAGQSQQPMGQSKAIVQVASKDPFQIQGTLTELQKAQVAKDQTITVTSKAVPNKKWKGKIIEVSDYPTSAEAAQAMSQDGQQAQTISYYSYKASLESQDGLAPGYHVSMQVDLSSKEMLAVPRSSIVEKGDSPFVYVVEGNKLHKTKVTTGMSDGDSIEILEGVKAGQKVVENPSSKVKDGMDVKAK